MKFLAVAPMLALLLLALAKVSFQQSDGVCYQTVAVTSARREIRKIYYLTKLTFRCAYDHLSVCMGYGSKFRERPFYVTTTTYVEQPYCCSGYVGNPPTCRAFCLQRCYNGGTCSSPNNCICQSGWTGHNCTIDVNECENATAYCGEDHICFNTAGSYVCECDIGYEADRDSLMIRPGEYERCKDIDECEGGYHECSQICENTQGGYNCKCRDGYFLGLDGKQCEDENECLNNNAGCAQNCVNTIGSYSCTCNSGFNLSVDMHNCTDIKECSDGLHNCQHSCNELEGGFICACFEGYQLENDTVSCRDIDECELGISRCQQQCINTEGSYRCDCRFGFQLNLDDNYTCIDINECDQRNGGCEQVCNNTYGSYKCSCKQGYTLELDGVNCAGQPCISLMNPRNGNYNCSGPPVTGAVCSLSCNTGYRIIGPLERQCLHTNLWSGSTSYCELLHCDPLENPEHGSVILPCGTILGTKCRITCSSGYYINSTTVIQECNLSADNFAEWTESPECIATQVCIPNPCNHNGLCSVGEDNTFVCNCEGTGYTGIDCNRLVIDVPEVPSLTVNSPMRLLISAKPDEELVLNLIPDNRMFFNVEPSSVTFSQNHTEQNILMNATKSGLYKLQFIIQDRDSFNIEDIPPASILVIDDIGNESNYFVRHGVEPGLLVPGCFLADSSVTDQLDIACPNDNEVFFNSTRGWSTKGSVNSAGVIFSNTNGFIMPIAIAGAKLKKQQEGGPYIETDSLNTFEFTFGCDRQSDGVCEDKCLSVNDIQSILHYESLAFTYLHRSMLLVPEWLKLKALPSNRTSHNENSYMVNLVYDDGFELVQDCNTLTALTNGLHSILVYTSPLEIQLSNETKELEAGTVPVCFATNLCEGSASPLYITIPNDVHPMLESFKFMSDLRTKGWSINITSLAISDSTINIESELLPLPYWNGNQYFLPDPLTPNMAVKLEFTKSFSVTESFEVEWYFDGSVQLFHKDFNEIFNAESSLGWNGNFSGSMTMNISITVNGILSTMQLTNDTTSSLLLAGDDDNNLRCHGCLNPMGFALKLVYHAASASTKLLSTLLFVPPKEEFGLPTQFSCPVDSFMFLNGDHNLEATSMVSSCLDIYLGMFPIFGLETHVYIFDECKISPFCSALNPGDSKMLVWSVFPDTLSHINLGYFIKLLPVSNSNKTGLFATFAKHDHLFIAELLNIEVSLFDVFFHSVATINERHLEFTEDVKLFDRFYAQLSGQISQTSNWENAPINIYGEFLNTSNNFPGLLCKQIDNYIEILHNRSQTRVRNAELVYNRALSQLAAAELNLYNTEISKNRSRDLVKETEEEIDKIMLNVSTLTNDLENANDEVKSLTERIDGLCTIQQCPQVCIPGRVCEECEQPVETLIQGTCTVACTINITITEIVGYENTSRYEWVPTKVEPNFCYCYYFECTTSTPCVLTALCKRVYFSSPITEDRIIAQPSVCNRPCSEITVQAPVPAECCVNVGCSSRESEVECVQDNNNCQVIRNAVYENLAEEQRNAIIILQSLDEARANERSKRVRLMRYQTRYNRAEKLFNESMIALDLANKTLTIAEEAFNDVKFENRLDLLETVVNTSTCASAASSYFNIESVSFNTTVVTESPTAIPVDVFVFISSKNETKSERVVIDFNVERFDMSLQQAAVVIADYVIFNRPSKRRAQKVVNASTTDENYLHFQSRCSELENIINYFDNLNISILTVAATAISSMANLSENMQELSSMIEFSSATFNKQINIDLQMIGNITNKDVADLLIRESNSTEEVDELLSLMQEHLLNSEEVAKTLDGNVFQSWQTIMEDLHNQTKSAAGFTCFGFSDCLQKVLEAINELINDIPPQNSKTDMLSKFPTASQDLIDLSLLQSYSIISAATNTQKIYNIVTNPVLNDYWCTGPPVIVAQPVKRINPRENTTIELTCGVEEEKYITYQWKKDCVQLPNQKNRTLVLTNVKLSDTGNYTCVVTNQASSVTSLNSSVEVQRPPTFFLQLENVDDYHGNWNGAIFKSNASGWPFPGFRWYFRPKGETEFTQIPDEDENELVILPPLPKDEGSYYCEAFNEQGFIRSRIANLTVLDTSVVQVAQTAYCNFSLLNDLEESTNFEDNDTNSFSESIFKTNIVSVLSTLVSFGSTYIENVTAHHNSSSSSIAVSFTLYSQNISYLDTPLTVINQLAPQARVEWLPVWEALQTLLTSSELIVNDSKMEYTSDPSSVQFDVVQFTCPIGKDVSPINNFLCVNCPPGSYQIVTAERIVRNGRIIQYTTQKCVACPVEYYQDEQGHTTCKKCPANHTTLINGARLQSDCVKLCSPGSFSENRIEPCMACPNGMYSIGVGSTSCFNCNDEGKRKLCPFVDPCEKCQQLCRNDSSCACHEGYTLSSDGYSCIRCAKASITSNRLSVINPTWHVALCNASDSSDPLVCSGSLINDQWVITSARCVCGHDIDIDLLSLRINKQRTCVVEEDDEIDVLGSEIHCHPSYNSSDDRLIDLALIKLSSPITKEDLDIALPLCTEAGDTSEIYNVDQSGEYNTYGLGNPTQVVRSNAQLAPAFVFLSPNSACFKEFLKEKIDYKSNPDVFCTDARSNSRCFGNPGSAVISSDDTSGKITFAGVISRYTKVCGKFQSYAASTKIQSSDVLQWIDNTIA